MTQIDGSQCDAVAGSGALGQIGWTLFSILASRSYNALDSAWAAPGNTFQSSPFLDAVAAGNMTA